MNRFLLGPGSEPGMTSAGVLGFLCFKESKLKYEFIIVKQNLIAAIASWVGFDGGWLLLRAGSDCVDLQAAKLRRDHGE